MCVCWCVSVLVALEFVQNALWYILVFFLWHFWKDQVLANFLKEMHDHLKIGGRQQGIVGVTDVEIPTDKPEFLLVPLQRQVSINLHSTSL